MPSQVVMQEGEMPSAGMNDADRQTIITNLSWLLDHTIIDNLIPKFVDKGIFSSLMVEKYKAREDRDEHTRGRELYLAVTHRGPSAFKKLIESFIETGHFEAAQQLDPGVDIADYVSRRRQLSTRDALPAGPSLNGENHSTVVTNLPQYELDQDPNFANRMQDAVANNPYFGISMRTEPLQVQVKMATTRMDGRSPKENLIFYKMGSRPKGYFLMINNVIFEDKEERFGAEVDERNLKALFEGLGYIVVSYRNQGCSDMMMKIKEFAAKKEHKNVDSCVVAVLSHGTSGNDRGSTFLVGSDGGLVSTFWIADCFSNKNCPHLINKPKIFIFQTCRGHMQDWGTNHPQSTFYDSNPLGLRTYSDILFAYSTIPGFVSTRDYYLGSWFIEALCKVFMNHACDTDIQDMLSMVDHEIKNLISDKQDRQTTCTEKWGFHKFYFNPGLYDDDLETMDSV